MPIKDTTNSPACNPVINTFHNRHNAQKIIIDEQKRKLAEQETKIQELLQEKLRVAFKTILRKLYVMFYCW